MSLKTATIILTQDDFIAQGSGRRVYTHPSNPDLIIKIQKPRKIKKFNRVRRLFSRSKRRFMSIMFSWVEIDEFAAMVARANDVPDFCAQFRGFVATNQGVGALFDAIRNPDGTMAPTLRAFAQIHGTGTQITAAIDQFWDDVVSFRGVVWDPNLDNLLVIGTPKSVVKLVLVDGLGERTFIPQLTLSDTRYNRSVALRREEMHMKFDDAVKKGKQQ